MKLEVSIGEAIDKYSILEIKIKNITDQIKQNEIQKELVALEECKEYITTYSFFYKLLIYINTQIWDMTDIIKSITIDNPNFVKLSNEIFEMNQKRFRLKNTFNLLTTSNLKEQKSYSATYCKIYIDNIETIYNKIAEINYLTVEYDYIVFDQEYIEKIKEIFISPNIIYINTKLITNIKTIILQEFSISEKEIEIFDFEPISYIGGGLLGDFIQSLSVINEIFYKTGKKGKLYISSGFGSDNFRNGVEYTFNDTYNIISSQLYIKKYSIYNNELIDINLNSWRGSPLLYIESWYNIYKSTYNIEWGTHKWIYTQYDEKWKDKILINEMHYRRSHLDYNKLYNQYGSSIIFISFNKNDYEIFKNRHNIDVEYYCPSSFTDVCIAINSCKLLVASLSALLTIGNATYKNRIIGLSEYTQDNTHNINLEHIWQNIQYKIE